MITRTDNEGSDPTAHLRSQNAQSDLIRCPLTGSLITVAWYSNLTIGTDRLEKLVQTQTRSGFFIDYQSSFKLIYRQSNR